MKIRGGCRRGAIACAAALAVALGFAGVLAGVLAFGLGTASAADQLVLGKYILIKDPVPGQSDDGYVKLFAKESNGATIVGDPTVGGATLRVIANGGTPSDQTFNLPASGWIGKTNTAGLVYYKYRTDKLLPNPVKGAWIKITPSGNFFIKALAFEKLGALNVVPPNPGTDAAIVLAIGSGDTYCSGFGGAAGGTVINEPPGNPFKVFAIKNPTAEIGACPP